MTRKGISFYIKIYFKIVIQDVKSKMSYRSDYIISTFGMIFSNIAGFIGFWILFKSFPSIKGWGYYEILFFYGFSLISLTPVQCFFDNNWNLRTNVYSGDFIKYCFRPINLFFYYQSEVFDIKGFGQFAFGVGTLIYAWNKLGLGLNLLIVLKLLLFLFTSSLIMIAIQNFAAATCFWIENSFFMMDFVEKMKDFAKYPVTIFPPIFRFIFSFIIPIAYISYYPGIVVISPDKAPVVAWISPLVSIIFFVLSYKVWMRGALKYNGTGS